MCFTRYYKLYFKKLIQMLMKPPSIFDDVVSQDSENFTVHSKQQSLKGKPGRKENTIKIGGTSNEYKDKSNERDNESVHSNGSRKSKGKKAKQTTLSRPKIAEIINNRDEDSHSVHSTGSKHSQKSNKKQSNIMQRPKIQQPYSKPKLNTGNDLSFKNAIGDPEESVIKLYNLDEESPKPVKYSEQTNNQRGDRNIQKNKKYAPFTEMEQKHSSEDDIPIFRIEQPARSNKPHVIGLARPDEQRYRIQEKKESNDIKQSVNTEQSRTIFDQSRMANTKSMRRPIFNKDELNNNSKVSNAIDQSNVSGIDSSSRRKSNSKLRQLFNNSREKNGMEQSLQNQSKISSLGELVSQSRAIKPAVGTNDRMVQIERKVVSSQNDDFGIDSIKSNLDLTVSNNEHLVDKERDSLIFEFEPQRKKGMLVTSKNKKLHGSDQELIMITDQLTSAKPKTIKDTTQNLPQIKASNIESKDLKHVDKLLKENQQFLRNSALLNLSQSDKLKRESGDDYLFKLEDDEDLPQNYIFAHPINEPWNQNKKQQEKLNIKKVQRNQKVPIKSIQKQQQNIIQQPKKIIDQTKDKNIIKKEKSIQQNLGLKKQSQNERRVEVKQDYMKSPGKISKNYDLISREEPENKREESENKSEKSNKSGKKGKSVKESAIPRDKSHKIEIKNEGPRADESFYAEQSKKEEISINDLSLVSKKPELKEEKKPNVYSFSDEENMIEQKPKSRTDVNFYDNQARSNRPPSSRPPLSGKSGKSRSTSKDKIPKQTTIKIGNNQSSNKNPFKKTEQPPAKKLTLMQRALMKHNQSSEDDRSQESFSSRQDFSQNSRKSSNSRGSKKSIKENTIKIDRKQTGLGKNANKPPFQRKASSNSSNQEEQMQQVEQNERQRSIEHQRNMMIANQQPIISKNCTFIDERGRLVQKDLIIKGKDVYGQSRLQDSAFQAMERMKRAKESHRSRSKSRSNKIEKRKKSRDEAESSSYDNSSYCSSFYENSTYGKNTGSKANPYNNTGSIYNAGNSQPQALKQFIKPVQQVPLYNQSNNERRPQRDIIDSQPRTFNDMFTKKNQNQNYAQSGVSNISESRSRRSLKRTEKSASKR